MQMQIRKEAGEGYIRPPLSNFVEVGEGEGALEIALKKFQGITNRTKKALKRHSFFLSKKQREREKHRMALRRQQRRQRNYRFRQNRDPKVEFALNQFEEIQALSAGNESNTTAGANNEKTSEATVLVAIKKNGKFLTLEDVAKDGKLGFVTGGINEGETEIEAAVRETKEESGLDIKAEKVYPPFAELNVARSGKPYFMKAVFVKNASGKLVAGIEIVPGSLRWRTATEIDDLIMTGKFCSNHIFFWNKLCEIHPEEV